MGTRRIAKLAHRMGITTPISTNPAMTIGGLKVGVTPLDMAHAYETIAHGGERVSGSLIADSAPVGIQEVNAGSRTLPDGHHRDIEHTRLTRVLPTEVAETETSMLETVLQYGTARAAAIGQFAAGKTGTTSNFGDAWFVGWDKKYTVAVWVGYPDKLVPMTTDFGGKPVFGGTYPALIWHDFMLAAMAVEKERAAQTASTKRAGSAEAKGTGVSGPTQEAASSAAAPGHATGTGTPSTKPSAPQTSAPQSAAPQSASPQPAAPAAPTPRPPHQLQPPRPPRQRPRQVARPLPVVEQLRPGDNSTRIRLLALPRRGVAH